MTRKTHSILITAMFALLSQAAQADTVTTSFENLGGGTITIGTSPFTATFTGGNAQTVGVGAYYHSGAYSWHVAPGFTGTVTFETAASDVNLWVRDTPGGAGEVRAIDSGGATVATLTI